ncbi:3-methyl-2-oxobutanoate hydroxymethyltransferase [Mycobacterium intracellulare]|uniref:3-methyl-2-oxobutanoate hydroxymethyltransferase n=1 Tax=Mycobacterium intracellulare TaxID=1767 RepID=UPI00334EE46D
MAPTLLNSCAKAATAQEALFRIDAPIPSRDGTRVIALDDTAATVVKRLSHRVSATHLLTVPEGGITVGGDLVVHSLDGGNLNLAAELAGADLVVMVATADADPIAADLIASGCSSRGIMTAGVILQGGRPDGAAVNALRPHAGVLMISSDGSDVAEVLSALRA